MGGKNEKFSGVVQIRQRRSDGWSATARAMFLMHLSATCNVAAACRAAGKHQSSLYRLRTRDAAFAKEWDVAMEQGYAHLEAELLRRALGEAVADATPTDDGAIGPPPPAIPFDAELAFKLLAQRRSGTRERRSRVRLRQPTTEEVLSALDRKLTAMERRLGKLRPGVGA